MLALGPHVAAGQGTHEAVIELPQYPAGQLVSVKTPHVFDPAAVPWSSVYGCEVGQMQRTKPALPPTEVDHASSSPAVTVVAAVSTGSVIDVPPYCVPLIVR